MIKKIIPSSIFLFVAFLIFSHSAFAQGNPFSLKFPVPELDNCNSYDACKAYCNDATHVDACIAFGKSHGIISQSEAKQSQNFIELLKRGDVPVPGCADEKICRAKCELPENQKTCVKWARDHGFIKESETIQIEKTDQGFDKAKALQIIAKSGGPNGCKSEEECSNFCSQSDNQQVCVRWAREHNLISNEDASRAEKFANHAGPGGCRGEECKNYCENPDHQAECLKFAKENGFISQEEADRIEKQLNLMKNIETQGGPGSCQNEDECRNYCNNPAHSKECIDFGKKMGFFSEEEADEHLKEFQQQHQEFEEGKQEFENNQGGSQDQSEQGEFQGQGFEPSSDVGGQFPGKHGESPLRQIPPGFEKEFQKQIENFKTPEGQFPQGFQSPSGTFTQPPSFTPPPGFTPPPAIQTPSPLSPPSSFLQYSPFGAILNFFWGR